MKVMNWIMASTLVLPSLQVSAQAQMGQSDTLTIDTRKLYLSDASNSSKNTQIFLTAKRQLLNKNHKKLGDVRDRAFTDMSKDYNLLNLHTGMTFWEEWQARENGDKAMIDLKYPDQNILFKVAKRLKPDLIHFLTWMRANGLSTFKSLMANDNDGILELEALRIANKPYEIDGPTYVVTKFKDVKAALDQPEIFSVRNYSKRMKDSVGDFMLGNDKKAINYEHTWARRLIDVKEMEPRIRPLVRSIFEQELKNLELVKKNPYTGQLEGNIEVVNHIARRVPAILTIKYFGFEGFSAEKIMEWSRATQDDFFHNIVGDQKKADVAVKAGQEMQSALVKLVDDKFNKVESLAQMPKETQTILDRMVISLGSLKGKSVEELIKLADGKVYIKKIDDEKLEDLSVLELQNRIKSRVRTNIIGTLVGGLETTQAAITQTLNLILNDKDLTTTAKNLANEAKQSPQSQQRFNNLIWEVLRFHPVNPVVFRYIEKDTEIGGVKMKAKGHIMIATQAAMFDEEVFPNSESLVLNRFKSMRDDKYFHLGYGHHRCLGDYVSMIQVPEVIAGILSLPNIRKMPGAFGELDFNKTVNRALLGKDIFDQSFPERMILEYDSGPERNLVMKTVEIQDRSLPFEGYLKDYDRNHFRGCLSGWNIVKDNNGNIIYNENGSPDKSNYPLDERYKTTIADFAGNEAMLSVVKPETDSSLKQKRILVSSAIRASQAYATNLREANNDLLYCRLPMKFHVCFESESNKVADVFDSKQDKKEGDSKLHAVVKKKLGSNQLEIRNQTEKGNYRLTDTHKTIFNKCATFANLTDTEKEFYQNRYFGKAINLSEMSTSQSQRPAMWDKDYSHEDYFSAQDRYYSRGSYANPLGWFKMNNSQIDFYVRLNFTFRTCVGDMIKESKGKVPRCDAYKACVNGVYNPLAFKYEGALSPWERKAYNDIIVPDGRCE